MLVLGAILCGSATYLVSTFLRPTYRASAYLIVDVGASTQSSIAEHLQAVPGFVQLITTPAVLNPVVLLHPGMTVQDIMPMLSVKQQSDTQVIELDVQASDPHLAANLANQISQSFVRYANHGTNGENTAQIIPAMVPSLPAQSRLLQDAGIGAIVGLLLALLLVALLGWMSNRTTSVEQIQELLGMKVMTMLPSFSHTVRPAETQKVMAEKYHMIGASLHMAQASKSFKLVMFTSALAGEGKSTIASRVAINLAQAGKQVLLIDLNIHRPALARLFHLSDQPGLTNLLARKSGWLQLEHYCQATEVPGLLVLTAGTQPMSSSDLLEALASTQLFARLKETGFDSVLFDAPALLTGAEARIMASAIEAMVLVVNGSHTPRRILEQTQQVLRHLQTTRVLGVIVNQGARSDEAETRSYPPSSSLPEQELQLLIEQGTMELPVISAPLPGPSVHITGVEAVHLPDTGENEQVHAETPRYIIRPTLSLSGTQPSNGLTRRVFPAYAAPETPSSVQK